jgi:hypothetical protein
MRDHVDGTERSSVAAKLGPNRTGAKDAPQPISGSGNRRTKNPVTGEYEEAFWIDDYFGRHRYGVRFPSGVVYRETDHRWEFEDAASNAATDP